MEKTSVAHIFSSAIKCSRNYPIIRILKFNGIRDSCRISDKNSSISKIFRYQGKEKADMVILSIIIPAYNEEQRLPLFLCDLIAMLEVKIPHQYEIIIINDGGTDRTAELARELIASKGTVIDINPNRGKGAAIKSGIEQARGEFACITDADGSVGLSAIMEALLILLNSKGHGVVGTRYLADQKKTINISTKRLLAGKIFAAICRLILGLKYSDTQCGFKMLRTDTAQSLLSLCTNDRFGIDFELLYIAQKNRILFIEMPVQWTEMHGSKVNIIKDGLQMLSDMIKLKRRANETLHIARNISALHIVTSIKTRNLTPDQKQLQHDDEARTNYAKTP